jgi:hypothetical protein
LRLEEIFLLIQLLTKSELKMVSLVDSIEERYGDDDSDDGQDYSFIVFVSSSPEKRKGMLPPILTLNDYNHETLGDGYNFCSRCSHIEELDLTDNLLSDWDVIRNILKSFPNLKFLNLTNNLLHETINDNQSNMGEKLDNVKSKMSKLVLNGNNITWSTVTKLVETMPELDELHLCTNNLNNPSSTESNLNHSNLKQLYLSCNPISDFAAVKQNLIYSCPRLMILSLAECPVNTLPDVNENQDGLNSLNSLNMSTTAINSWQEVDKLRKFKGLEDLRLQGCPFLTELTAHERRMLLIARLPNVKILNGGDPITALEREDAERAFIRDYMDVPVEEKPIRVSELILVHGELDPLVNVDLTPEIFVKVKIYHQDECREESISVRKTVKYFKNQLQQWFNITPANMRLYYYDQVISKVVGPEEMKWAGKGLYTYNVREGDYFVLDEKAPLKGSMKSRSDNSLIFGSPSPNQKAPCPKGYTSCSARANGGSFNFGGHSPKSPGPRKRRTSAGSTGSISPSVTRSPSFNSGTSPSTKSPAQRNLFGTKNANKRNNKKYGEFHYSKVFPE